VYEGDFDKLHGSGTYTWADGQVYDGEWADDLQNGGGAFTIASGDGYIGEWVDGKTNGRDPREFSR